MSDETKGHNCLQLLICIEDMWWNKAATATDANTSQQRANPQGEAGSGWGLWRWRPGSQQPSNNEGNVEATKEPNGRRRISEVREGGKPSLADRETQFELETREKRKRAGKVSAKNANWFEESLLSRQRENQPLSKQQTLALDILTRKRSGEKLSPSDRKALKKYTLQGLEEREDRNELAFLLEKQKVGDNCKAGDLDRIRHLQLLQKKRSGCKLKRKETDELKTLEAKRTQDIADMDEYHELLAKKNNDREVDEGRFLELSLYYKRRKGKEMTAKEQFNVRLFDRKRIDDKLYEKEYSDILDQKAYGEPVDERRLHILELADKRRRNHQLTDHELKELKEFDDECLAKQMDHLELDDLLRRQTEGKPIDAYRLLELQLAARQQQGEDLTDVELDDLNLCQNKREDDEEEYENLLQRQRLFEEFTKTEQDRLAILELVNKRKKRENLNREEWYSLKLFDAERTEELQDIKELQALRDAKDSGDEIDETRLGELELLEKQRDDEELTEEEQTEWKRIDATRRLERPDKIELSELLSRKKQKAEFDKKRLRCLELLGRRRAGDELTEDEEYELVIYDRRRRREKRDIAELKDLLDRKDEGQKVNEDRIYELTLFAKKLHYEDMTRTEQDDYELFASGREVEILNDEEDENIKEEEDRREVERIHKELEEQGLPSAFSFRIDEHLENSTMTILDDFEDSYLDDLSYQKEKREESRKEEMLEEALQLYQIAIKEKGLTESEKLFTMIYQEVIKENEERFAEEDRKQDELIEKETKLREMQRSKRRGSSRASMFLASYFTLLLIMTDSSVSSASSGTGHRYCVNRCASSRVLASPSIFPHPMDRRRSRRSMSSLSSSQKYAVTALMAKRQQQREGSGSARGGINSKSTTISPVQPPEVSFDDLSPLGKVVAGTTQIAFTTLFEYISGYFAGITIGTIFGIPGLLFRPVEPGVKHLFRREVALRMSRMNTRSLNWAKLWGTYSAAFGGFRITAKVVRGGRDDNWNSILSTAAAGAFFARNEGPQAMLRSALLYGAMVYLLSGGTGSRRVVEYMEEPVDF